MRRLQVVEVEERALGIPCVVDGCNGIAVPTKKDGRFYPYKNALINLPVDFTIPRCSDCGTELFTDELHQALLRILEVEYQKHASLIDGIVKRSDGVQ